MQEERGEGGPSKWGTGAKWGCDVQSLQKFGAGAGI